MGRVGIAGEAFSSELSSLSKRCARFEDGPVGSQRVTLMSSFSLFSLSAAATFFRRLRGIGNGLIGALSFSAKI